MARKRKRDRSAAARKGWITRRRNAKRRTTPKRKRIQKPVKKMYRVTVGAPYEIRKPRNKKTKKADSPDTAAYMVRGWYSSRRAADNAIDHLEELAEAGRESVLDENPKAFVRDKTEALNVKVEVVDFDEQLLDIIEETDEQ
jgi:hypothetical protein